MLNFTVGPVQENTAVREIGARQTPYFRTPEFSSVMLESESMVIQLANAQSDSRAVFITGSGTAAMEAVVMNCFSEKDKVLVVNGGSFGQRFSDLCRIHRLPFTEIKLEHGNLLKEEHLLPYSGQGYTGLLVNAHETSTGVLYDLKLISRFCQENQIFFAVDAISSFLADPFDMKAYGIDIMITASQKTLACPPGVSIVVLSPSAIERVSQQTVKCMYFDLKTMLKDGVRGQTPFTPAVGILLQIHERLKQIIEDGGAEGEVRKAAANAEYFRKAITGMPLQITSDSLSNAMTPLHPLNVSAENVFTTLKDEYEIWVCPNGGKLKERLFRVGHIGELTIADHMRLVAALRDMEKRKLL